MSARIRQTLNAAYLRRVAEDDDALHFVLSCILAVEANEEARFFEAVQDHVDGPLARAVARHAADEDKHVVLVTEALRILGRPALPVPADLEIVPVLDEAMGGCIAELDLSDPMQLGRAYLVLHALERRMAERMRMLGTAIAHRHPEIAAILFEIAADEKRHIAWCQAVARKLIGDDEVYARMRDELVDVEARAYARFTTRYVRHILRVGFTRLSRPERLAWRLVGWLGERLGGRADVDEDVLAGIRSASFAPARVAA